MSTATAYMPGEEDGTRPIDGATEHRPDGMADHPKLKSWLREDVAHFLRYRDQGEAEEAAVYGIQWEEDEVTQLEETDREALVFNHLQKVVFGMYGWRADNRYEFKYLPKEISDTTEGGVMTETAKHLWDDCLAEFEMARSALSQYVGPLGWVYVGQEQDDPSKGPMKAEHVPWREMRYCRDFTRDDLTDCERVSRERFMPLDKAIARWPEHEEKLRAWAQRGRTDIDRDEQRDWGGDPYSARNTSPIIFFTDRRDVRMVQTWYRVDKPGHYIKTPTGWEVWDMRNPEHQYQALMGGQKVIKPGTVSCVYWAEWFGGGILEEGKSPYSHKFFPFVPIWGLRDHEGLPHGAVHALIDSQKVVNWTRSKLLWLAQGNQWLLPNGAVDDIDKFRLVAGRPDGVMEYNWESGAPPPQRMENAHEVAVNEALHLAALEDLQEIGGSPEESRGQESNADSGISIQLRQMAAMRQQGIFLDNEQRATLQIGLMWRSMIQDFVTDETIVRITQPNGAEAMAVINVTDPLRRANLQAQGYQAFGTVTRGNYDTKVVLSPKSATVREQRSREQAVLAKLMSPAMLEAIADILVLQTDIPDKEKIAARIQAFNQLKMLGGMAGMVGPAPAGAPMDPMAGGPPPGGGPPPDDPMAAGMPQPAPVEMPQAAQPLPAAGGF